VQKGIIREKEDFEVNEKLTPPRVMTSEGEVIFGEYNTGSPEGDKMDKKLG